jgi:hypothetical protein
VWKAIEAPKLCAGEPSEGGFVHCCHDTFLQYLGLVLRWRMGLQGLESGETKAAVAGGVNVMLAAPTTARICLLQALSHVGRCRSFDAAGDGYGRGEGFTVALLR